MQTRKEGAKNFEQRFGSTFEGPETRGGAAIWEHGAETDRDGGSRHELQAHDTTAVQSHRCKQGNRPPKGRKGTDGGGEEERREGERGRGGEGGTLIRHKGHDQLGF